MFDAVPAEIRQCPQWLVWQYVWNVERNKWDKIPLNPRNGSKCSVTDPLAWTTFDHALTVLRGLDPKKYGLGFVLGGASGIVGIDLDGLFNAEGQIVNRMFYNIAQRVNGYTEYSPSGTGLHILVRAKLDGGRRVNGFEVYGSGRFFTVTGRAYANAGLLVDGQEAIDGLIAGLDALRAQSAPVMLNWSATETKDDKTLYDIASTAANGERFALLWQGRFLDAGFSSQSEADFALINIIGHYTESPQQIQRMFRRSMLGQRDKAMRDDYVNGMIGRSQDRKPPMVTLDRPAPVETVTLPAVVPANVPQYENADEIFEIREGMAADIYKWLWSQSMWPMSELCMVTTLGLLAGICGRQYQFNGGGLNLYMMLLARTGMGKEAMSQGVSRLFDAVCNPPVDAVPDPHNLQLGFPAARDFMGPSALTGKGLINEFKDSTTLAKLTVWTEFSREMAKMANPNANEGTQAFQTALLDFYTKSAKGSTYGGSRNSDNKATVGVLHSPAFSIITEGTPGKFYGALNEAMITEGLLSRFIIIESKCDPIENEEHYLNIVPPKNVKDWFANLCVHVIQLKQNGDARIEIGIADDAKVLAKQLMRKHRAAGKATTSDVTAALWMRAFQNAQRMAALIAITVDPWHPVITTSQLLWANRIIERQVGLIIEKFKTGEVGARESYETDQYALLLEKLMRWTELDPSDLRDIKEREARQANVVPYRYLMQHVSGLAAFKHDKRGVANALRVTIDQMEKTGVLRRVSFGERNGTYYTIHL